MLMLTLVVVSGFGQSARLIDSVEAHLNQYAPGEKAFALFTLVSYYQRSDQVKTREYRRLAQGLLKDPHSEALTYARIIEGIYHSGVGPWTAQNIGLPRPRRQR